MDKKIKNKLNLGILTFPASGPNKVQLSQLIELFIPISNELHVLTGNEAYTDLKYSDVFFYGLFHRTGKNKFSRVFKYFLTHMKISYYFLKIYKRADIWVFMGGAETLLIPMMISFMLRKKVFLLIGGFTEKDNELKGMNKVYRSILHFFKKVSLSLTYKIILYSPILIERWNLSNYKKKILIAHQHFYRVNNIKLNKFSKREKCIVVGYIGRLSKEKGVLNFIKAAHNILKVEDDIQFFIGGTGPLLSEIKSYIEKNGLKNKFLLKGWIPHNNIYDHLKQLNLLVLPSYTEGLPGIVLESMASRTPVLVTPVGAIPDIIQDGKTGFIMENNSPECISNNVIRSIRHEKLEEITENAFKLIKEGYSYENTVKMWEQLFCENYE